MTQVLWHTDLIAQIALDPWAEAEAEADEYEVFKVIIYLQVCTGPCRARAVPGPCRAVPYNMRRAALPHASCNEHRAASSCSKSAVVCVRACADAKHHDTGCDAVCRVTMGTQSRD